MIKTFDATVDFETAALDNELARYMVDGVVTVALVRADSDGTGELYTGDDMIERIGEDDWCVSGTTIAELASALRACL